MTIDEKIRDKNCNMILKGTNKNISITTDKIDNYEYLTSEEILSPD